MSETPLAARLRRVIEANGPISVADYMAHCLGDPEHGYYVTRDPLGAAGDFITAPEVSQMFGEIVGAWLVHAWRLAGAPAPIRLVELGPGRGTLMADILRVSAGAADLRASLTVHLVETSPVLRRRQAETLAAHSVAWHDRLAEVPDGPTLLVANEFFDALPLRQFVRAGTIWRERAVGLGDGGRLAFGLGPGRLDVGPDWPDGSVLELRPAADAIAAGMADRIVRHGGAALIVDYGHGAASADDTLQSVRRHVYADPLEAPGEADLTAHVDFAALALSASTAGAAVHGPMEQGAFLLQLGLLERAVRLGSGVSAAMLEAIEAAVERLAGPREMGTLFKVLALTPPGIRVPPFSAGV